MVFINIPERMFAIGDDESRAVGAAMERSFELGDVSPGAATREYFEIPNIEIMASELKEGAVSAGEMVNVYILSSGNQFHLSMVLQSDSDLLRRMMNKKVKTLDDLVNNLKDFFQKTDWMFTDAEKKIYGGAAVEKLPPGPDGLGEEDQIPKVPKAPKEQAPPSPKYDPIIPRSRIGDKVGTGSVRYFQNLYRKGLIKDEIFRRLMGQYGIDPDSIKDMPETSARPSVETSPPPGEAPPEGQGEEGAAVESDDELLSMLDDTLSDFSDEPEEAEPVTEPEEPPE
jgi:hypothetical protein